MWLPDSEWAVRSSDQTSKSPENKMFRRSLTSRTEGMLLAGPTNFYGLEVRVDVLVS